MHVPNRLIANTGEVQRDAAVAALGLMLAPSFVLVDTFCDGLLRVIQLEFEPTGIECSPLSRQFHTTRALRRPFGNLVPIPKAPGAAQRGL